MVQEEILFKDISNLELWRPLYTAEQNYYAVLDQGITRILAHEEMMNWHVAKEIPFKDISFFNSGDNFVPRN